MKRIIAVWLVMIMLIGGMMEFINQSAIGNEINNGKEDMKIEEKMAKVETAKEGNTLTDYAHSELRYVDIEMKPGCIEIEINYSKLFYQIIYNRGNEVTISMASFGKNVLIGDPELPLKICELALPPNIDRKSIKLRILEQQVTYLGSGLDILPVLPPETHMQNDGKNSFWVGGVSDEGRGLVYRKDLFYPSAPIKISSPSQMRKWIFISMELWPFQYNPYNGVLQRNDFVKCRIDYELEKKKQFDLSDTLMDNLAQKKFINYNYAKRWYDAEDKANRASKDTKDYIIITTNDIVSNSTNLSRFITHKKHFGLSVKVITENDYGGISGQYPNGTAEKIRQWLIDNYIGLGIKYVLLIGDPDPDDPTDSNDFVGEIPMKMLYPRVGNGYYLNYYDSPSDYFYADLTGNWNLDGDELFGECRSSTEPNTPDPSIEKDTYSIRWTGKINITNENGSRIAAYYDDGVRIWIDNLSGEPIINDWNDHVAGFSSYDILSPGLHDIKIEYYQNKSNAFFRLLKGPVGASWFYNIPASELYYWNISSYQSGGLNAEYFNDMNLSETVFTRVDPQNTSYFDFQWFSGDNGEGGVDFAPEVYVGRIPVYNNNYSQLDEILDKTMTYQRSSNTSWRRSVLLPMKPSDDSTPGYQLGEHIKDDFCEPFNFSYYRVYDEDYDCTPPPEATPCTEDNVLNAWKNGYGFVSWFTHGGPSGASSVFDSSLCHLLDDDKPAFTFQASCYNGYPESSDNLGYSLLKHGAVATVSSSRVSWYAIGSSNIDPNRRYNQEFCYFYSGYMIQNNTTGESLSLVKDIPASLSNGVNWMNIFDYNLYGDPSLAIIPSQPENQPPQITYYHPETNPAINESESIIFNVTAYDSDEDSLIYTWYLNNNTLIGEDNTTYIYTSNYSSSGVYNVAIVVSDGFDIVSHTWVLTVVNVNRAPVIDSYLPETNPTITEEQSQPFSVVASDPDADVLTITWYLNNSLVTTGDSYTFIANYTSAGWYEIKVIVSDGVLSANRTWILTVTNVNRAPAIESYSPLTNPTIAEEQTQVFTVTATDPDGDVLTITWYLNNSLVTTGNLYTFIANYTSAGFYNVKVIVSDGNLSINHTWVLTVTNVNRAPAIESYSPLTNPTITEEQTQLFTINASDPDGENLTIIWYLNNSFAANGTAYTFTANYTSAGWYEVKVVVSDGNLSVNHTWILTVNNMNAPPNIDSYSPLTNPTISEEQSQQFTVSTSDLDGEVLTINWYLNDSLVATGNSYTFTANYTSAGRYELKVIVSDGELLADRSWILTVTNVNRSPAIETIGDKTAYEGQVFNLQTSAIDSDNDTLTFSDNTTLFNINPTTGLISFTPNYDSAGVYFINITVTDGADIVWQIFKLTIINVNRAPVINSTSPAPNPTINEGQSQTFSIEAYDPDGSIPEITWKLDGTIVGFDTSYSFSTNYTSSGQHIINATVTDGEYLRYYPWTVTVNNVNQAPTAVITSPAQNAKFSTSDNIYFDATGSLDLDNDVLTYTWTSSIDGNIGYAKTFYGKLSAGTHTITLTVSDGTNTDYKQIVITVEPPSAPKEEPKGFIPGFETFLLLIVLTGCATVGIRRRKKALPPEKPAE